MKNLYNLLTLTPLSQTKKFCHVTVKIHSDPEHDPEHGPILIGYLLIVRCNKLMKIMTKRTQSHLLDAGTKLSRQL